MDDTISARTQLGLKSGAHPTEAFFPLELFLSGCKVLSPVTSVLHQHQLSCYKAPQPFPCGLSLCFSISRGQSQTLAFLLYRQVDPCMSQMLHLLRFSLQQNTWQDNLWKEEFIFAHSPSWWGRWKECEAASHIISSGKTHRERRVVLSSLLIQSRIPFHGLVRPHLK